MPISPDHIARLSGHGGYCTGTLISPDTVLTCGHYLKPRMGYRRSLSVEVAGLRRSIAAVEFWRGTDIAVVTLDQPVEMTEFPEFTAPPAPGTPTATFGLGGNAQRPELRLGRYLGPVPLAISRRFTTRIRRAGLVYSRAIPGDSGGPVLAGGKIFGVQSLILDPWGRNLRIATVSLVHPGQPGQPR